MRNIPKWLLPYLPASIDEIYEGCATNFKNLAHCPELYEEAASVLAVAAVWPGIESFSGSYLDFDTKILGPDDPQIFGPYQQSDPTCVPRQAPPMDEKLSSDWYD